MVEREVGLAMFFLIGLFSGAHCLGMCGPLITLYSDRAGFSDDHVEWRAIRQHLMFNLGRAASYALIGALMGALGRMVFDIATIAAVAGPVRGVMGILVGVAIIATGVAYLRGGSARNVVSIPFLERRVSRVTEILTRHVDHWVRGPRIAGLGMVHGLLPCPILYPAYMYALTTGSPIQGGLSLAALGLGTVPILFLYGTVLEAMSVNTRIQLHRGLGVAFVVLGYLPLSMGLMAFGVHLPHPELPIYQPLEGI